MAIQSLAIVTICSDNYVPTAKALAESAQRHHPEATLYTLRRRRDAAGLSVR